SVPSGYRVKRLVRHKRCRRSETACTSCTRNGERTSNQNSLLNRPCSIREYLDDLCDPQNHQLNVPMNNPLNEFTKRLGQSTRRETMKKFTVGTAAIVLACLGLASRAKAGTPTFTTLDFPGGFFTLAAGINSAGEIVGRYANGTGNHGFLLSGGTYTTLTI